MTYGVKGRQTQLVTGWWFQTFGLISISHMGCHPSHWRTHIFQGFFLTTNQIIIGWLFAIHWMIIDPLVNVYIANWKDPPCYSWVNHHFQWENHHVQWENRLLQRTINGHQRAMDFLRPWHLLKATAWPWRGEAAWRYSSFSLFGSYVNVVLTYEPNKEDIDGIDI